MAIQIIPVDYASPNHRWAVVSLLDSYAGSPQAGGVGMPEEAREQVVSMLEGFPTSQVLLAVEGEEPVGLAVCVESFSTFKAKPLVNVHDLVVSPNHRNRGIGQKLLEAVEEQARRRGCVGLTLEVLGDNKPAQRLYHKCGFVGGGAIEPAHAPMFWKKLWE